MTDEPDREEDIALAAEYALGLLTPDEAEAFEARLAVDPAFRADYAVWAEDFVSMTDAVPEVTPPLAVKAAIDARLFPGKKRSFLQRIGIFQWLLGGLATAAVLIAIVNLGLLTGPDETLGPSYQVEIAAQDESLRVVARYDPAAATLRIERSAGAAAEGRVLELWLIAGDAAPVSLGVLPDAQTTEIPLSDDVVVVLEGAILAISDEPVGGSPTGQPTGDVLAVGQVTTI
jgi:anti-sigma-K factor RskA